MGFMFYRSNNSNMKNLCTLVLFSCASRFAQADFPLYIWGSQCPDVKGSSDFSLNDYLGVWYNIANSPFFWMSSGNRCPIAEYTLKGGLKDDGAINVGNSEMWGKNGKRRGMDGTAVVSDNLDGSLNVGFWGTPSTDEANYYILGTDNAQFSYVWSCSDSCFFHWCSHKPTLWILNRDFSYTDEQVNEKWKKPWRFSVHPGTVLIMLINLETVLKLLIK